MLYRKILFYYCLLVASLLFFWLLFFSPLPQNFIPLILLLPIPLHFWLTIVYPRRAKPHEGGLEETQTKQIDSKNNMRLGLLIMTVLSISSLSIFVYSIMHDRYLESQKKDSKMTNDSSTTTSFKRVIDMLSEMEAANDNVLRQIEKSSENQEEQNDNILRLIEKSSENQEKQSVTLGATSESTDASSLEFGFIKPKSSKVQVRSQRSVTSGVVDTLELNKIYPYTNKVDNWYQVTLSNSKKGWVESRYVDEV